MMMTRSRPYTFAFSSLGCPESTLGEVLDLAEKYKVPLVELRTLEGRTDLAGLFGEQFASADALRELLDGRGIGIASLDSSAKLIGGKPEAEEELYAFGWWAHQLGIPGIRVFDGGSAERGLSSQDIEEAVAFLRRWHESCHRNGWDVDLLIETHDALSQSASVLQLEAATSVPLRILWDAHHTWKKAGETIAETWSAISHLVRHIHFKDSISKPSARHPFTYVQLGTGEFDLHGLACLLRNSGFSGVVSLEWEKQWHPYLSSIERPLGVMENILEAGLS